MKKYNVLVVNQDFKSLHTIFDYLEDEGKYNVMNATNAQMVQRIIRKKSLDVVLLDWETSIASELEVYHYLQQQESTREVPIVISTHPARTQTINEIITTDISAFVPKPIERVVLTKCIMQAIAGHREAKAKKAAEENALAVARQKMLEEEERIAQEKAKVESKKNAVIEEQRRLKKELAKEKERLSATKAQLETQKEQIHHNQNSIEATKGKIEETQESLQQKTNELQQAQESLLEEKEALLSEKQVFAEAKATLLQEQEETLEKAQQEQQQLEEEKTALQHERERLADEQARIQQAQQRLQTQEKDLKANQAKLAQEETLLKTASKEMQEAQKSVIKREVEPTVLLNTETKHTPEQTDKEKDAEMASNPPTFNPDALQMEREQLEQARQQLLKAKERFEQEREEFLNNRDELLMENTQAREKGKDLAHLQRSVLATKAQLNKLEEELTHKQASLKLIEMEEKVAQRTNSAIPAKIQESLQAVATDNNPLSIQGESFSKLLEKEAARLHTSSLMQYILPEEIARDLDETDYVHVNYHPSVSILYIGFEDLMNAVLKTDRSQLINELEVFFKAINDWVQQYGLERVRTKNNMYACAHRTLGTGDPIPLLKASLDIRQMALNYQAESNEVNQLIKKMYLGINTTDVVAGDTMHKRFAYDIWSDIIQTTHHLKKNLDIPIHLLQNTYRLVQDQVSCEHVGKIRTNRRGDWQVYELVEVLG